MNHLDDDDYGPEALDIMRVTHAIGVLDHVEEPILRAVLDHHSRDDDQGLRGYFYCTGCDQGCSCDGARWPCSTVLMIAETLGLDLDKDDL